MPGSGPKAGGGTRRFDAASYAAAILSSDVFLARLGAEHERERQPRRGNLGGLVRCDADVLRAIRAQREHRVVSGR